MTNWSEGSICWWMVGLLRHSIPQSVRWITTSSGFGVPDGQFQPNAAFRSAAPRLAAAQ